MEFQSYKTDSLERIAADPRYIEHHSKIEAILRSREGHLSVKRGIEVLSEIAKSGKTTNYKVFFEACVGGEVKWNRAKMGQLAKFLGRVQRYCFTHKLPILTALVVNIQTGECGDGFFKDLCDLGLTFAHDDPKAAAQMERKRCWNWSATF